MVSKLVSKCSVSVVVNAVFKFDLKSAGSFFKMTLDVSTHKSLFSKSTICTGVGNNKSV
jgi:hypothetical protein